MTYFSGFFFNKMRREAEGIDEEGSDSTPTLESFSPRRIMKKFSSDHLVYASTREPEPSLLFYFFFIFIFRKKTVGFDQRSKVTKN